MLTDAYRTLMDPSLNPLSRLPSKTKFQLMTLLAYMWSTVFGIWAGSIWLFGGSVFLHMILLVGVFFTSEIFRYARKETRPADPALSKE
ncbi:MAG: hypothetical protein RLT05_01275 [Bauldia litoralis]